MNNQYLDTKLPIEKRVEILLQQMTLEEKLGQMMQLAALDSDYESYIERYHLGSYLHVVGEEASRLQQLNLEKTRLKIPLVFGIDAIHGHCLEDETTVFPVQLAMACTWNSELIKSIGNVTANEARASHLHWTFSPVLCMGRDPRWGRTSETFGEDTLLVSTFAAALCDGYQSAAYPIAACAKHYAAYGDASGGRDSSDTHMSERLMRNILLPPFEKLAKSGCKTFMAGYQSLNGIPCSANTWLMNDVLREEWGYEGVVVTDWNNCGQMLTFQHAVPNMKEAVFQCLQASNDIFMSTPEFFYMALELIRESRVKESRIDESVRRILKLKFDLGLFNESKTPNRKILLADKQRWELCLQSSRESLTLVKNNGILPLDTSPKKILLVGENADCLRNQLGDWSFIPGLTAYEDTKTHRADTVTLHQSLEDFCKEEGIDLVYFGAEVVGPECNATAFSAMEKHSAEADIILFCAGDALKQYGEFHDRADLDLTGNQNAAFSTLLKTNTPIISILIMSKPHCINSILERSAAVLIAFNPGAKGGIAITECLFGKINPCGRLPISFPRHVGQLPVYYNQAPGWHSRLSPHYNGDNSYVDLPPTPLLAFGEGLSYSDINYGETSINKKQIKHGDSAEIHLNISNNSQRDAIEIVQLYKQFCIVGVTSPEKQLHAFQRVHLPAKKTVKVVFSIKTEELLVIDKVMQKLTYAGELKLMIGKSSKNEDLQTIMLQIE